jgi:hypothetical protein
VLLAGYGRSCRNNFTANQLEWNAQSWGDCMNEIYVEPIGDAVLVDSMIKIPAPCEFLAAFDGYRFYHTDIGMYALEE